jgi:hypothetical protein
MNFLQLANLRPGQPMSALADAIGESWKAPEYIDLGLVRLTKKNEKKFWAKLDTDQRIGELSFSTGFPENHRIEGLYLCMLIEKALLIRPQLTVLDANLDDQRSGTTVYLDRSEEGYDIEVHSNGKSISNITLRSRSSIFPSFEPADSNLKQAFDVWPVEGRKLPDQERGAEWAGGWTFGLPPGIQSKHWPLDPEKGYPLRHAFTLHLPPQYRVKGMDLVALSFFVGDEDDGGHKVDGFDPEKIERHPHGFNMEDSIYRPYVGIWLSQEEFDGPLCQPPIMKGRGPKWYARGYAATFNAPRGADKIRFAWPDGQARADLTVAFPLSIASRDADPNVGKPPRGRDSGDDNSYTPIFSERGKELDLERFHAAPHVHHLGGTMYGGDWNMRFGPYYLEFHEDFADFNFAGGDMQIDLKRMALNWSH